LGSVCNLLEDVKDIRGSWWLTEWLYSPYFSAHRYDLSQWGLYEDFFMHTNRRCEKLV